MESSEMVETIQKMDDIVRMQGQGIAILAFHLNERELAEVTGILKPDASMSEAAGCYMGLPVYTWPYFPDDLKAVKPSVREHEGIRYSCLVLAVWD